MDDVITWPKFTRAYQKFTRACQKSTRACQKSTCACQIAWPSGVRSRTEDDRFLPSDVEVRCDNDWPFLQNVFPYRALAPEPCCRTYSNRHASLYRNPRNILQPRCEWFAQHFGNYIHSLALVVCCHWFDLKKNSMSWANLKIWHKITICQFCTVFRTKTRLRCHHAW